MKKIIIRLDNQTSSEVSWAEVSAKGHILFQRGPLKDISATVVGKCHITVLIPGEDVFITSVTLPGSAHNVLQAVPFALEELLTEDVEKLHFVLGPRYADNSMTVAVISRDVLGKWLTLLSAAGIVPDAVTPETVALPEEAEGIFIAKENDMAMIRFDRNRFCSVDWQNIEMILLPELQHLQKPSLRYFGGSESDFTNEEILAQLHIVNDTKDIFELMAQKVAHEKLSINLLQDSFAKKSPKKAILKLWRLPLILVVILAALYSTNLFLEYHQLKTEYKTVSDSMKEILRHSFPDSRRIVKPYVQMQYKLEKLRNSQSMRDNLLNLLNRASPIIAKNSNDSIESLRYKDRKLLLTLNILDLKSLDSLKTALNEDGNLDVEIKTANAKNSFILARLQITEKKQ